MSRFYSFDLWATSKKVKEGLIIFELRNLCIPCSYGRKTLHLSAPPRISGGFLAWSIYGLRWGVELSLVYRCVLRYCIR